MQINTCSFTPAGSSWNEDLGLCFKRERAARRTWTWSMIRGIDYLGGQDSKRNWGHARLQVATSSVLLEAALLRRVCFRVAGLDRSKE